MKIFKLFKFPLISNTKPVYNIQKANFFWNSKQKQEEEKAESDFESISNIGYLIEQIKLENKKYLPSLLPPQTPEDKGKLTVVFEMDETLLFTFHPDDHESYMHAPLRDYDYYVDFPEFNTFLSIYKRNNFDSLLKYLQVNCEPIIFSQGDQKYVDKVMDIVDPDKIFKHRLYQDSCNKIVYPDENIDDFVKDLNRLNRDIKRVVYIDCKPIAFWMHPNNSIPIMDFQADNTQKDDEIIRLIDFLQEIQDVDDVRPIFKEKFGVEEALLDSKMI